MVQTGWRAFGIDLAERLRNVLDSEADLEGVLAEALGEAEARARVQQLQGLLLALQAERAIHRGQYGWHDSFAAPLASVIRRALRDVRQSIAGQASGGLYGRIVDAEARAQDAMELVMDRLQLRDASEQDGLAGSPTVDDDDHDLPRAPLQARQEYYNDTGSFAQFVRTYPPRSEAAGVVERFVSHGAYVLVNDARGYVSLKFLGDPPPRSAKEVLRLGETRTFVVVSVDVTRRTVDFALPGVPRDEDYGPAADVELLSPAEDEIGQRVVRHRRRGSLATPVRRRRA